jgi:hypothetical protein
MSFTGEGLREFLMLQECIIWMKQALVLLFSYWGRMMSSPLLGPLDCSREEILHQYWKIGNCTSSLVICRKHTFLLFERLREF